LPLCQRAVRQSVRNVVWESDRGEFRILSQSLLAV
jgi:hypothetical protein